MSNIICITKTAVDDLVKVLDESIMCLEKESMEHTGTEKDELRNLIKNAKSEREIYAKVNAHMEIEGSDTLCLESEISGSEESRARRYYERRKDRKEREDVDISEVNEPRREPEEPGTMGYF